MAPTADRFGFGPLIATQPLLHHVNSNLSKSRWETYLTAVVTCSRRAEGSEVKPSKGQLPTLLWPMISVEIRLISYFLKDGKNIYGGKKPNLQQTHNITENDWNPNVQVSCDSPSTHALRTSELANQCFSFHFPHFKYISNNWISFSYYIQAS